ncbi:PREDICTED: uncharacterized protein LOC109230181 [Nicotiana attenuata]|uniref:uncharacterized protein LOC109230181 n=1 Tax=Nicotiana attenuata TaxID=49451 RepID=UPI0009049689|nr:PREDICTED: uncharacterized protein LOC109230181 [Nicotiana attenuata]
MEDAKEILYAGPYSIANRPIILKPWTPDFDFTEEFPTDIPLWVKFPKLPMSCWGMRSLSRIASVLGKPIFADECTTKQTRVSYARMLIEINVTKELPSEIWVMEPNGKKFLQDVIYDWKPSFCEKCQTVGHKCPTQMKPTTHQPNQLKKTKVTQEWRTKAPATIAATHKKPTSSAPQLDHTNKLNEDQIATEPNELLSLIPAMEKQEDKGKKAQSQEFNLLNFPPLSPIPVSNRFEAVSNGKGVNKRYKQKEVREYIRSNKINLVGLVETKVKEANAHRIAKLLVPGWGLLTNYNEARNGRIWILWDTNILNIIGLQDDPQMIHCLVRSIRGNINCYLTVVYGFNGIEQRRSLWEKLQHSAITITDAWLVAGDFNAMLYPNDRKSCNPVNHSEIQEFSYCIQQTGLSELPWKGDYYTWTNKYPGADRVCSRLDRVFGNYEWMMNWSHVETIYGQPQISDHNPMILILADYSWKGKVPFRFFNAWADHDKFQQTVADS